MTVADFMPEKYTGEVTSPTVTWRAPSNIALVKYWGKHGLQLPMNPSVSFTLDACATTTQVALSQKKSKDAFSFEVIFEGKKNEAFRPKIQHFLERIAQYLPFLMTYHLEIRTRNSFPHSSGIASSASGMAALALCLMDFEQQLLPTVSPDFFKEKASFLARLGSGSAARSIEGPLVVWGKHKAVAESSDLYGVPFDGGVHPVFQNFHDTILLVDKGEKKVSSTVGHGLMEGHPFAEERFLQANEQLQELLAVFGTDNLEEFIQIVESEALTLHAMMMTSSPNFLLMKPDTLAIIEKIRAFREKTGTPICFTLDAGANVHVLYPEKDKAKAYGFIQEELLQHCAKGHHICDRVGFGAKKL